MVRDGQKKTVVLGMGNLLLKDEGIGIHVAHALQESPLPDGSDLRIVDGATSPDVFFLLGEVDKLVIVDAARGGSEPGAIYRFLPEDITLECGAFTSVHQVSLIENLKLMQKLGQAPEEVVVIGIEPEEIDWGLELSPNLQQRMPRIIEVILEEIGLTHVSKPEKGA